MALQAEVISGSIECEVLCKLSGNALIFYGMVLDPAEYAYVKLGVGPCYIHRYYATAINVCMHIMLILRTLCHLQHLSGCCLNLWAAGLSHVIVECGC